MKKLALLDLESRVLLIAIGTCIGSCIWRVLQLIHPVLVPNLVGVVCVLGIGTLLAISCSRKGSHAVARSAVLSACFGAFSFLNLIQTRNFLPFIAFALVSVSYAGSAFRILRQTRRESRSSVAPAEDAVQPKTDNLKALSELPMMPVRDIVVIPGMRTPFVVGRESSVRALEYAEANNSSIFLATQHDDAVDAPRATEISKFGCGCKVLQSIKMTDGNFKVLVEGLDMAKAVAIDDSRGFFFATVQGLNIKGEAASTTQAA